MEEAIAGMKPYTGEQVVRVESVEQEHGKSVVRVRFKIVEGEDRGLVFPERYDTDLDFRLPATAWREAKEWRSACGVVWMPAASQTVWNPFLKSTQYSDLGRSETSRTTVPRFSRVVSIARLSLRASLLSRVRRERVRFLPFSR